MVYMYLKIKVDLLFSPKNSRRDLNQTHHQSNQHSFMPGFPQNTLKIPLWVDLVSLSLSVLLTLKWGLTFCVHAPWKGLIIQYMWCSFRLCGLVWVTNSRAWVTAPRWSMTLMQVNNVILCATSKKNSLKPCNKVWKYQNNLYVINFYTYLCTEKHVIFHNLHGELKCSDSSLVTKGNLLIESQSCV